MQLQENVPPPLIAPARAALAWINDTWGTQFRLTGVVDTEAALGAKPGEPLEFGVVLCEGELCRREQVRVTARRDGFEVTAVEAVDPEIPALLDPPIGVRSRWIDGQVAKHRFVLLLFYRGRW